MKIAILLLLLPALAFADTKILTCEESYTTGNSDKMYFKWQSVFDTNDFVKERPEHEFTLLEATENGIVFDLAASTIGSTYRNEYRVSPTTLSFKYCIYADRYGNACILGTYYAATIASVNRKDLSIEDGSCTITDFKVDNLI